MSFSYVSFNLLNLEAQITQTQVDVPFPTDPQKVDVWVTKLWKHGPFRWDILSIHSFMQK
jgi:hypothetical protein